MRVRIRVRGGDDPRGIGIDAISCVIHSGAIPNAVAGPAPNTPHRAGDKNFPALRDGDTAFHVVSSIQNKT